MGEGGRAGGGGGGGGRGKRRWGKRGKGGGGGGGRGKRRQGKRGKGGGSGGGVCKDVGDRGRLRISLGAEYDQGRRDRRQAIKGGERGGDRGANGALTVLHSGSSISIALLGECVSLCVSLCVCLRMCVGCVC